MEGQPRRRRGRSLDTQLQAALDDAVRFSQVTQPDELSISRLKSATQRVKVLSILVSRKKIDLIRTLKDELKSARARIAELESQLAARPTAVELLIPPVESIDGGTFDSQLQAAMETAKQMARSSAPRAEPIPSKPPERVILAFRTEPSDGSEWKSAKLEPLTPTLTPKAIPLPPPSPVKRVPQQKEKDAQVTVADIEASVAHEVDLKERYAANQRLLAELRAKRSQEENNVTRSADTEVAAVS